MMNLNFKRSRWSMLFVLGALCVGLLVPEKAQADPKLVTLLQIPNVTTPQTRGTAFTISIQAQKSAGVFEAADGLGVTVTFAGSSSRCYVTPGSGCAAGDSAGYLPRTFHFGTGSSTMNLSVNLQYGGSYTFTGTWNGIQFGPAPNGPSSVAPDTSNSVTVNGYKTPNTLVWVSQPQTITSGQNWNPPPSAPPRLELRDDSGNKVTGDSFWTADQTRTLNISSLGGTTKGFAGELGLTGQVMTDGVYTLAGQGLKVSDLGYRLTASVDAKANTGSVTGTFNSSSFNVYHGAGSAIYFDNTFDSGGNPLPSVPGEPTDTPVDDVINTTDRGGDGSPGPDGKPDYVQVYLYDGNYNRIDDIAPGSDPDALAQVELTLWTSGANGNAENGGGDDVDMTAAALRGTLKVKADQGVAEFSNLRVITAGEKYYLRARVVFSSTGEKFYSSVQFDVYPRSLKFSQQPGDAVESGTIKSATSPTQPVIVQVLDKFGVLDTSSSKAVTLHLWHDDDDSGTYPTTVINGITTVQTDASNTELYDSKLLGTTTVAAVNGECKFTDLKVTDKNTNYRLIAVSTGVEDSVSDSFEIFQIAADHLAFSVQPVQTTAGATMASVQVEVQDSGNNVLASAANPVTVTLWQDNGDGTFNAGTDTDVTSLYLQGTKTVTAVNGVATFGNLKINKADNYFLQVSSPGLTTPDKSSDLFAIVNATASKLTITTQPDDATSMQTIPGVGVGAQVKVEIQDTFGNKVTTATNTVDVQIENNPSAGTLSGSSATGVAAVGGVATFSDLRIDKAGTGYTLRFSSGALSTATSAGFDIAAGATSTQLEFVIQPQSSVAGTALPEFQVATKDDGGNVVPDATLTSLNFSVSIQDNPSSGTIIAPGATINYDDTTGIAKVTLVKIDKVGTGYTLKVTAGSLTSAISSTFNITVGTASKMFFTTNPPTTNTAGASFSAAVQIRDAYDNQVTTATNAITLNLDTSGATGTDVANAKLYQSGAEAFGNAVTVNAVGGVATFSNLSVDKVGADYQLDAAGVGAAVDGRDFDVTATAPSKLSFKAQPAAGAAGVALDDGASGPVKVEWQDTFGNQVATASNAITVSITSNTGTSGATLSGTATRAPIAGVASFDDLRISLGGAGYTLTATSGATTAVSDSFDLTGPTKLAFGAAGQPGNTTVGAQFTVKVEVQDAGSTVNTNAVNPVTISLTPNTGNPSAVLGGTLTRVPANGVVTFDNLTISQPGSNFTLTASTTGLTSAISTAFNVAGGGANAITFAAASGGTQPVDTDVAQTMGAVKVVVLDSQSQVLTTANGTVTVAITTGTGSSGAVLSGTLTRTPVNGIATFSNLSIDKAGTDYTLTATYSLGGLSQVSDPFDINQGVATKLAFTTQPATTTAGATMAAVVVEVQDANGVRKAGATDNVTIGIGTNPSGGTLSGTVTVAAVDGVATFSTLSIDKSGTGYALTATSGVLTQANSTSFNIDVGAPTALDFQVEPTDTNAGAPIAAVKVSVVDDQGNVVTTPPTSITIGILANTGTPGANLSGTLVRTTVNGVATFSTLRIDLAGTDYILAAVSGTVGVNSAPFDINQGPATQVDFTTQPTDTTAGATMSAVVVEIQDANGDRKTGATNNVTLAIATNPGGGTLSGTKTVAAVDGVATFSGLSIDKYGLDYTVAASATGLTGDTSGGFDINYGAASQLVFTQQPTDATAGQAVSPAIQVAAQDALGNTVLDYSTSVTMTITPNTGTSGAAFTATTTADRAPISGIARFNDLGIDLAGTNYTLTATSGTLTQVSDPFDINAVVPAQISFQVEPSDTQALASIAPAVEVVITDANGVLATSANQVVTLSIPAALKTHTGGTLGGTVSRAAVNGVATFDDLTIDKIFLGDGTYDGYQLTAEVGLPGIGVKSANSQTFSIYGVEAAQIAFLRQPANTVSGAVIGGSPNGVQVEIQDVSGNRVTNATSAVTIQIKAGSGNTSATLSGTKTVNAVAGVATFDDLNIDLAGSAYVLTATSGLFTKDSANFNITAGAAAQLNFINDPLDTQANDRIYMSDGGTPPNPVQLQVEVLDSRGNRVTTAGNNISMAIGTNPSGGTLGGTTTATAASGVATFPNLSINNVGNGYTLTASSGVLTPASSSTFNITPATGVTATDVKWLVNPVDVQAGAAFPQDLQVAVVDINGQTVTSSTKAITLSIMTNPGLSTLSGTVTKFAVNGIATFSGLTLDKVGTRYVLLASTTDPGGGADLTEPSATFDVLAGGATKLSFTVQPTDASAGIAIAPDVIVAVQDANDNTVTSATVQVAVAIGNNPGGSTLSGTLTKTTTAGVATFSGLSLNKTGVDYTLLASSTGLTSGTSDVFDIMPGAATQLVITGDASNEAAGAAIAPPLTLEARDALGNVDTSYTGNVTASLSTNPTATTLGGTTTVAAVAGVVSFADLNLQKVGTGYVLGFTDGALPSVDSSAFNITPAAVDHLVFSQQPTDAGAGVVIAPSPQVEAYDAFDNLVTNFNGPVAMTLSSGTLYGTTTRNAAAGVATFNGLSVRTKGTGYTLTATASGQNVVSTTFDVAYGALDHLAFVQGPGSIAAGTAFAPVLSVRGLDPFNNLVENYTGTVTLGFATNPSGGSLLGASQTADAVAGVATFGNDVSVDKVGTGYQLSASATGATAANSAAFNVTPAAATKLSYKVQPADAKAGEVIPVEVQALDGNDNLDTNFTGTIAVALTPATNPKGATLSGTVSVDAVAGVAVFTDLSVDFAGTGYTLDATSDPLTMATSAPFAVQSTGANRLAFETQPSDAVAGAAIAPSPVVEVVDSYGNVLTTYTGDVTISIGSNPGSASLSGTATVTAVAGLATFADLSLDKVGTGYTLSATAANLVSATSATFDITPGAGAAIAYTVQPSDALAGAVLSPAVVLSSLDGFGNVVTTDTRTVDLTVVTNPGTATLGGTVSQAMVAGVATFADLTLDKVGTGYVLGAAVGGGAPVNSNAFNITPAAVNQLSFEVQPTDALAGAALAPAVKVAALDALGNPVPTFNGDVAIALKNNPAGGTLSGTMTVTASNGVATFNDLKVDKVGAGYTLEATSAGLTAATSGPFTISAAAVDVGQSTLTATPTQVVANGTAAAVLEIVLKDAFGNPVPGVDPTTIEVTAQPNDGVTVTQPTVATDATGKTTAQVTANRPQTSTLRATVDGKTLAQTASVEFQPRPVDAAKSSVTVAPATIGSDQVDTAVLTVTLKDAGDVPVIGSPPSARTVGISGPTGGLTVSDAGQITGDDGICLISLKGSKAGLYDVTVKIGNVSLTTVQVRVRDVFTEPLKAGLHFLGLPFVIDDPRPLSVVSTPDYRLARYDLATNGFVEFAPADNNDPRFAFLPTRGLWLRLSSDTELRLLGDPTQNTTVEVTLEKGWNSLANPFNGTMPWDLENIQVVVGTTTYKLGDPSVWGIVPPYAWIYTSGTTQLVFNPNLAGFGSTLGSIPRLHGFWYYSDQAGVKLRLVPPTAARSRARAAGTPQDWSVMLQAQSAGDTASCVVGVSGAVTQPLEVQQPPVDGRALDLSLLKPASASRLAGELLPYSRSDQQWDLEVTAQNAGDVTLSWPDVLRRLPKGLLVELVDQQTGQTVLLNTRSSYSYAATRAGESRRMQLRTRFGRLDRSEIQGLAVQPSRGAGTTFTMTLSGPADITVVVRGLGGKVVKQLRDRADAAGTTQVTWDGTDAEGRRVPRGTYVIEATAAAANGAVSKVVRTVTVQ